MSALCAILLAAGRGTRMGGPKLTMSIGGTDGSDARPWWSIQAERLARAQVHPIWVVATSSPPPLPPPPPQLPPLPGLVTTAEADAPMFHSVRAGLRAWLEHIASASPPTPALAHLGVMLLPIDTPAPHPDVWAAVAAAGIRAHSPAAPRLGSTSGHPLFLPHSPHPHRSWVQRVLAAPPTARLDHLTHSHVTHVPVTDADCITNLNDPQGLAAWQSASRPPNVGPAAEHHRH